MHTDELFENCSYYKLLPFITPSTCQLLIHHATPPTLAVSEFRKASATFFISLPDSEGLAISNFPIDPEKKKISIHLLS